MRVADIVLRSMRNRTETPFYSIPLPLRPRPRVSQSCKVFAVMYIIDVVIVEAISTSDEEKSRLYNASLPSRNSP
jgi:hypothetical protein